MKRLNKLPLILITFLLFQVSCSKDWLKPDPLSFLAPENAYVDRAGFESVLITLRKNLTNECAGATHFISHEWMASEAGNPLLQLDYFKLTPNSDRYQRFVAMINDIYGFIKNANVIISRVDDIEWAEEADRNFILAEAYWHRSYWYYRLVNTYGDLPFVSEELTDAKLDYRSHSRWAILGKIQEDMEFAVQWLPKTAIPGAPTEGAGYHLLTKIYLANLEFDKAVEAADRVINGGYALMTSRFGESAAESDKNVLWDLHRPANMNSSTNTETILAIVDRFEAPEDAKTLGLYTMRIYNPSWWHSLNRDSKGAPGMIDQGSRYDSLGRGNPDVCLSPYYSYDIWSYGDQTWQNSTDGRRANANWVDKHEFTYNNPASADFGKPWNGNNIPNPNDSVYLMYPIPVYITYVPQQDPAAIPMGGNGDWYIFRLAETYLLRAEAHYWKGELGLAASDINAVRQRAGALPISADEVTIDFIFDERARELFAEEPRHSELVRVSFMLAKQQLNGYSLDNLDQHNWFYDRVYNLNRLYHMPEVNILGNQAKIAPFHFLWPIDDQIITANTLGVINQNKGYNGAENNLPPLETIE